jgi:hypothetical protein
MTNQEAGAALSIVERLRARLPICPFDPKAPKHDLEASDPCPVCSDYGDERSKNLCRGADTRVMDEAADTIEELVEALKRLAESADATAWSANIGTMDSAIEHARALLAKLEAGDRK